MPKTHIENLHNNGTVNINHEAPHIVPKVLTQQVGLANDIDFVGRKEELQKVDDLLNQNSMLLLLNGIGGIGKSTLASYYLNQKKDEYDYYGFVQVNKDIKLSFVSAFNTSLNLQSEKIDDLFAEIMSKLNNLDKTKKKLLIIDDVKEMDNQKDEINTLMTLKNNGFQILFTSRESKDSLISPKHCHFLDRMTTEDARELFLNYFPTVEIAKVDRVIKDYLDYHTLFIEITAKTLSQRKRTLSLDKMIEKFDNGEFASIQKSKDESFNQFLNDLFSDDKILQDEETLLFLKRFSVLPSIEISFEDLYKFLVCEDEEKLELLLNELVDNGWLIESDRGYKFHQILKEFVLDFYLASFEEIEVQVDYLVELIENSNDLLVAVNQRKNIIYFDSLEKIFEKIKVENEKVANFYLHFGNICRTLEFYGKIENLFQKALKISKKILGENHTDIAIYYNNLASFYNSRGNYERAEEFYFKALRIREELLGKEHLDTVTTYNNLAEVYRLRGLEKKALPLYIKALQIRKRTLGEEHHHTASSYNNLALLYTSMEVYEKAKPLYIKALEIKEKIFGKEHPDTAISYHNLAKLYHLMGEYLQAEPLYLKASEIWKDKWGEEHSTTATSYNDLGSFYTLMENYNRAEILLYKSLRTREHILGKKHSETASSYNNLGIFHYKKENFDKSNKYMKKSIDIYSKILPKNHSTLINSQNILMKIEEKLKEHKELKSDIINKREV